jgi:Spy/CpxP family protein refolding chaperone
MRKMMLTSLSLFLGLTLMATAAMAWGSGFGRSSGTGQEFDCLDLPILGEVQFHKVEALQEGFLKESELLQHDLVTKKTELRILGLCADSDPAAVKAKQEEILNLRSKLQEKVLNLRLEIWKLLTPEQQAQMSLYGPGMGHGMGKMGRMGRW